LNENLKGSPESSPISNSDEKNKVDTEELWKKTGFQRILGGFWHNYLFNLFTMAFGVGVIGLIFPIYILPFPEAMGFKSVVSSLFALMFTIFDVGIGTSVTRFVAEYAGRGEIRTAMEYFRFFVWFQMITGLIQVTIVAIWAIWFATQITIFAPLVWFFLINSCVQYPGMLGIYKSGLGAFQRFDKVNILSFVQSVFLESTTQIIFILIGRYLGSQNPIMGELMGATMGYIIGLYIDDFLALLLSAYYFSKILRPYGISIWDTFIPRVSKKVMKESLSFGLKNMAQGLFYEVSMLFMTFIQMLWLPNYATIIGLFTIADTVTRVVIQDLPTNASVSEAYNSGKLKLTDYYIQSQFKWYGILTFYLAVEIGMLIPPIIGKIAANYSAAAGMIPFLMVSRFFIGPIHFSDSVQQGCNKPEYAAYSLFVQMAARLISFTAWFPNYNLVTAYLLADVPAVLAKNIFAWWLIDRKIIKVRINVWQTLITPAISIIPLIPINLFFVYLFNIYATDQITAILIAAVFMVFILFGAPIFVVFPIIGFFGGWDQKGLLHLQNAGAISGPSKVIVNLMHKFALIGMNHSPLKHYSYKFRIPWEEADREANELIELRKATILKYEKGL
jgi:O-antigen/teichoic acid export membrane protein